MIMRRSAPTSIDEYIAASPSAVRPILREIRRTISTAAPEAEELISYRMPAFRLHGILIYFAAFKNHIGLYPPVSGDARLEKIDFDREELLSALTSHSYVTGGKTFFILEGVTQYLTDAGVRRTFDFLAKAAVGSRLAFSYVRKDFMDGTACYGLESIHKRMVAMRQVWRFGMAPERVADFLQHYSWRELEHLGADEVSELYLRPFGRALRVSGVERIVCAEKP